MNAGVNVHMLSLAVGLLVLVVAGWQLASIDGSLPNVLPPSIPQADVVKEIKLEVSEIRDFEHYYGSKSDPWQKLNPFVPTKLRNEILDQPDDGPEVGPDLPVKPPDFPVPESQPLPPRPKIKELPRLGPAVVATPKVVGILRLNTGSMIKVTFGDGGEVVNLQRGSSHSGWTFVGVDGNDAIFFDENGFEHRFDIGDQNSGVTNLGTAVDKPDGSNRQLDGENMDLEQLMGLLPPGMDVNDLKRLIKRNPERAVQLLGGNARVKELTNGDPARVLNLFEQLLQLQQQGR